MFYAEQEVICAVCFEILLPRPEFELEVVEDHSKGPSPTKDTLRSRIKGI